MTARADLLRRDLWFAMDAEALATVGLGMRPDGWQADLLRSSASRVLLNCSRQSGKSTITSVLACQTAAMAPDQTALIVAPSERQAKLLFDLTVENIRKLGALAPETSAQNSKEIRLRNGSRIVALPGTPNTTRGYAADLVAVDEAAHVQDDAVFDAIGPTVAAKGGKIILLSTPWGKRGRFYELWNAGVGWETYKVTCWDCPRLASRVEFLEEQRRDLGPFVFSQEYECKFIDSGAQVFQSEIIEAAVSNDVEPLWPGRS
jgi:hypothetical protein